MHLVTGYRSFRACEESRLQPLTACGRDPSRARDHEHDRISKSTNDLQPNCELKLIGSEASDLARIHQDSSLRSEDVLGFTSTHAKCSLAPTAPHRRWVVPVECRRVVPNSSRQASRCPTNVWRSWRRQSRAKQAKSRHTQNRYALAFPTHIES